VIFSKAVVRFYVKGQSILVRGLATAGNEQAWEKCGWAILTTRARYYTEQENIASPKCGAILKLAKF
jgi:hypothetical protein